MILQWNSVVKLLAIETLGGQNSTDVKITTYDRDINDSLFINANVQEYR